MNRTATSLAPLFLLTSLVAVSTASQKIAPGAECDRVVLDALLDALKHPDAEMHGPAASALAGCGTPAIDAVTTLLRSDDLDCAARAAAVLGKIGGKSAMRRLAELYRDRENVELRRAAIRAIAEIAARGPQGIKPRAAAESDVSPVVAIIDGEWSSNWGPMSLKAKQENGAIIVTGGWVQGAGMNGQITRGRFDPQTRVFAFEFDEPWHNQTGAASLTMTADGKSLSGSWQFHSGGEGSWSMQRPEN